MTLVATPCAVCGGITFDPMFPSTIRDPEADPAAYFSSSRRRAGYLTIVKCRTCGLVMTNPRDDDATLAKVYAQLKDTVYDAEEGNRRRTALDHLDMVRTHRPEPARLLDVGCATGVFADAAREGGWDATGLDASAWAVQRARERYPRTRFTAGALEEAQIEPASFEVVTLWDVLEHVRSPAETLHRVRSWLVPGGHLFLNLPNADSGVARVMGRAWVLLLREHLWYFSPSTIGRLLPGTGFDLVAIRPNYVRFSLANIAGRLGQYPGVPLARKGAASPALKRLSFTFPIGEMSVVARKR
jgi:2-polyprenyl-3-methyl-5-hydroxy-6-metoxy-1,4-benzoquinol methylase